MRDSASLGAAAVLACGFGAAAAVFTLVYALLFKPLPYPDPDRLVAVRIGGPSWSRFMFEAIGRETTVFAGWTGLQERAATLRHAAGRSEQVRLESVSAAYFDLLGVRPEAGRLFVPDDDRRETPAGVVVVSHGFARRQFGTSAQAVGQSIELEGRRVRILGVLPAACRGLVGRTEIWSPLSATRWLEGTERDPERVSSRWFEVVARLAPGISLDDAQARFEVDARRGLEQVPNWQAMFTAPRIALVPIADTRSTARVTTAALILLGGAALVVLMATVNLAGLQLARMSSRRREFAIRLALGGTPWSIARGVARDVALVVAAGLVGALVVRELVLHALLGLPAPAAGFGLAIADPFTPEALRLDVRLVVGLLGCAALTWLSIAIGPALRIRRADIEQVLRRGSALPTWRARWRGASALVGVELAVATVLLTGAVVMTRSATALASHDRGYRPDGVFTMQIGVPARGNTQPLPLLYDALADRAAAIPGVQAVGIASCAPGVGRCRRSNVQRLDGVELADGVRPTVGAHFMTPGVIGALGADLTAGRDFDRRDTAGSAPVAIVSGALAVRLWPGQSAIGRRVSLFFANGRFTEDREVVGVIRSIEYDPIERDPPGDVYFPAAQAAWSGMLFVRADGSARGLEAALRDAAAAIDPNVLLLDPATMASRIGAGLVEERFVTATLGTFAAASVALALFGTYVLVRVSIAQRTREFGIRVAVGASRGRIVREVIRQAILPAAFGVTAGLAASYWLVEGLSSLVHGVAPRDPLTFVASPLLLLACTLAACAGPARRAGRADPLTALKAEA